MPEVPATPSPDPPSPSPEPHGRPTSPEGSQSPVPAAHGRPRLKKILIPLVLFALGVVLSLVAYFVIYPSPETGIPAPAYSQIYVEMSVPIGSVVVNIYQGGIGVRVLLPNGAPMPPTNANEEILIFLPSGANFYNCQPPDCVNSEFTFGLEPSFEILKLKFTNEFLSAGFYASVYASFQVRPSNFGMDFDGSNAYAAIPEIILKGPRANGELFVTSSFIPSASSYDWSSSRPTTVESSSVTWAVGLKDDDTAGRTVVGINHAREANDVTSSFFAGALIGLAGAAILSAIQEALHIFTDRDATASPEPNSEHAS
jgi:hypothetical protein